jgi:uncharacterized protein (TIGR02145 family)
MRKKLSKAWVITLIVISSCSSGVKDINGNSYNIVKIGTQDWMGENLDVSSFRNGDIIEEAKTPGEWIMLVKEGKPAWCIQQGNKSGKYGKLYNWYAVNDPRGLAPKGWHIPSDEEWKKLTDYLGGEISAAFSLRTTGLKSSGENNETGFSGLPAGFCNPEGIFSGLGSHGYWWTSTEVSGTHAWGRFLDYAQLSVNSMVWEKNNGLSVRCLKD